LVDFLKKEGHSNAESLARSLVRRCKLEGLLEAVGRKGSSRLWKKVIFERRGRE